jgi:S-DNA-T family DNA segregation ATPase FtsK/SpoIIIE
MQRRLRLGYTRAARIMDELENRGIVGPSKGAEPRDILIDLDGEGHDGGGQQMV